MRTCGYALREEARSSHDVPVQRRVGFAARKKKPIGGGDRQQGSVFCVLSHKYRPFRLRVRL